MEHTSSYKWSVINYNLTIQCLIDYWGAWYGFPLAFHLHFLQYMDLCSEVSCKLEMLCNKRNIATNQMATLVCNWLSGRLFSQRKCLVPCILSCNMVAKCGFNSYNCKVNKQACMQKQEFRILCLIRDQRTKKQGNNRTVKQGGCLYLQIY